MNTFATICFISRLTAPSLLLAVLLLVLFGASLSLQPPPPAPDPGNISGEAFHRRPLLSLNNINNSSPARTGVAPLSAQKGIAETARPTPTSTAVPGVATRAGTEATTAEHVLVLINGQALAKAQLEIRITLDRVIARLLDGSAPADAPAALARLINGEVILQAATAAGFSLDRETIEEAQAHFLTTHDIFQDDLDQALQAAGISPDTFYTYFAQLILIDRYITETAREQALAVDVMVRRLQQNARISFGPAAVEVLADRAIEPHPAATSVAAPPPPTPDPPDAGGTGGSAGAAARGIAPGNLAPDFSLSLLQTPDQAPVETETIAFGDLLGTPTILSFWTTWCPYCRRQTPILVDAYHRYAGRGVQVIGINVEERPDVVAAHVAQYAIPYPIALDRDATVARAYLVRGYPTTYFLDEDGHTVARHVGALTQTQIDNYIDQLLTPIP